jgi:formate hydrogenlyase subunit 6/NADH:ubiquinone oxidoreductase subunit I
LDRGYTVIGPTLRDGAICYQSIQSLGDLPVGWTADQEAGGYRLRRRTDGAIFGFASTPESWKRFLHPPSTRLVRIERTARGLNVIPEPEVNSRQAFLGVRSCDLHAITIQDQIFLGDHHCDSGYQSRRNGTFIVAVQCSAAGAACFCGSIGTGPRSREGFDLALTEILEGDHRFLVEVGSSQGGEVLAGLKHSEAQAADIEAAERAVSSAAIQTRRLDTQGLRELLLGSALHPRWKQVAERCTACTNCTMVCPTCFCTNIEDTSDLSGQAAERWRHWDSCFTQQFSYIHGGSIRNSIAARYRQWLTHKLAFWWEQFGTSGCVGCGRCITWCPVGIDLTEEVRAIRANHGRLASGG